MYSYFATFVLITCVCQASHAQEKFTGVAVIAPSVSTSMKAREIRVKLGWQELSLKKADVVLVVVRSVLFDPLMPSYRTYCKLEKEADAQLNIAGLFYHIYLFRIEEDFSVTQFDHKKFEAND